MSGAQSEAFIDRALEHLDEMLADSTGAGSAALAVRAAIACASYDARNRGCGTRGAATRRTARIVLGEQAWTPYGR
jgi:hypothetical protein